MSEVPTEDEGTLAFFDTKRSPEELKIAYDVLHEFKSLESRDEWLMVPFAFWVKFEQFEEMLRLLAGVEGEPLVDERMLAAWAKRHPPV